jgi:hypothetical protein
MLPVSTGLVSEDHMSDIPATMTVPEAGRRYFDATPRTSYRLVEQGVIPVLRVGKRMYVKVAELERQLGMRDGQRPAAS